MKCCILLSVFDTALDIGMQKHHYNLDNLHQEINSSLIHCRVFIDPCPGMRSGIKGQSPTMYHVLSACPGSNVQIKVFFSLYIFMLFQNTFNKTVLCKQWYGGHVLERYFFLGL